MGHALLILGRILVWVFIFGIACLTYYLVSKKPKFKNPQTETASFPCPCCNESITTSYRKEKGRYICPACQRTVVFGMEPTEEDKAQMRREEMDCAAVERYLNNRELFERVISAIHYPNASVVSIAAGEDRVDVSVVTRGAGPNDPAGAKADTIQFNPVPLGYRIETNAGRVVFHRALIEYVQRYYYESWTAQFAEDRLHVKLCAV